MGATTVAPPGPMRRCSPARPASDRPGRAAPNGRHADARGLGAGQEELVHGAHVPDGASADETLPADGHVDESQVGGRPVDLQLQDVRAAGHPVDVDDAARHKPGSEACHGTLGRRREHVVGAGRYRDERNVPKSRGGGAVRAVAPERHDARHARRRHQLGGPGRVSLVVEDVHLQQPELDRLGCPVSRCPAQVRHVRHGDDAPDAGGLQTDEHPAQDVHLLVNRHVPPVRHQTADVLAGGRIRDDAYGGQRLLGCPGGDVRTPAAMVGDSGPGFESGRAMSRTAKPADRRRSRCC